MAVARPADWKNPDYTEVYRERDARLARIRRDDAWDYVRSYYRDNPIDFIEDWLITYDPRALNAGRSPYIPFILFPRQQQLVAWMQDREATREGGLIDKSRDMGVSWVCLAFSLHHWTYFGGFKVSFGSRKEDLVDKLGDPDSLLERFRIMVRMLPIELRPAGYVEQQHARYMKILNPENGAAVTGEAGDNIGRGGRSSIYFLDEAAFIEKAQSVEAALSQNTDVRFDVSTPHGNQNPFAKKRHGGRVKVFTFHWSQDPRKDNAWYQRQVDTLDPEVLAQEVDLDYDASGEETAILPKWVRASAALRKELQERGALPDPDPDEGIAGLDVGGGTAPSVFIPRWGALVGVPRSWKTDDTTNTAAKAAELAAGLKIAKLMYDVIGVGRGVASSLKRLTGVGEDDAPFPIKAHGINVGDKPTNRMWPDGVRAGKKFTNLKAELWWTVRERLKRTYEHWLHMSSDGVSGKEHELEDLLLLPDDQRLTTELMVPGYDRLESGKIQIERKTRLKSRGVKSTDYADSLVLTFAPDPPRVRYGRTKGNW